MIIYIYKYIHIYTYRVSSQTNESNIVKLKFDSFNKRNQISISNLIHELMSLAY